MTREQLRELARKYGVRRGRNAADTIENLQKAGIKIEKNEHNGVYVPCAWRQAWIMWDLDNGHSCGPNDVGRGYFWVFKRKSDALKHRREQYKNKFSARLSVPFKISLGTFNK